jgi:hypothetical protein
VRRSGAIQRWSAEARPFLTALIGAEDELISRSERPAVVVRALCDQLDAAVMHARTWHVSHRCPDAKLGVYFNELISASQGMSAIMQLVAVEAPGGGWIGNHEVAEKVGANLMDRIAQATRARRYLREWRYR